MVPKEALQQMLDLHPMMIQTMFPVIGYKTELTFENLKEMERIINLVYPEGHTPMPTTAIPFGIHVGNILVKQIPGAKWNVKDEEYVYDLSITCPGPDGGEAFIKPIQRVANFWKDRTDTIFGWAEMIRDLASGSLSLQLKGKGQWVYRDNGTKVRIREILEKD